MQNDTVSSQQQALAAKEQSPFKCVVWDLDNTLWQGVLLEGDDLQLREGVVKVIKTLDERGILQSIASKNHHEDAEEKLKSLGLWDYFLCPQINWNAKSHSIELIAKTLNIHLDTFAFIDDQAFEREEVAHQHPMVETFTENDVAELLYRPRMMPKFLTSESKQRRQLYKNDMARTAFEGEFNGASDEFMASLNMVFSISHAQTNDLQRAEELTMRTNQLNSTGYTYSYDELAEFIDSPDHIVVVARLKDKFGSYGTIGLSLIEKHDDFWRLKLLLMSCRVMSRGVGSVMLHYFMAQAKKAGVKLQAEFVNNDRNRMMNITYRFSGFKAVEKDNDFTLYEHDLETVPDLPNHLELALPESLV